jgi:hypothetical protein
MMALMTLPVPPSSLPPVLAPRTARLGAGPAGPVKRAFTGLALALAIGLVPAAYYARGVCGGEVARIRARQAELSRRVGSAEVNREFDQLDLAIDGVRRRGMRNTALLWLLVTGIAGAGWYKLAPGEEPVG